MKTIFPLYKVKPVSVGTSCGGTFVASDKLQTFSTPNWPENYPNNQDCFWIIRPDGDKEFDISLSEGRTELDLDFVQVRKRNYHSSAIGGSENNFKSLEH